MRIANKGGSELECELATFALCVAAQTAQRYRPQTSAVWSDQWKTVSSDRGIAHIGCMIQSEEWLSREE